jgi:hypothetical protein
VQATLKPRGAIEALFKQEDLRALGEVCLGRQVGAHEAGD